MKYQAVTEQSGRERMVWEADERLYQPRIHSDQIRGLHRISEQVGQPMTILVARALDQFIDVMNEKGECYG